MMKLNTITQYTAKAFFLKGSNAFLVSLIVILSILINPPFVYAEVMPDLNFQPNDEMRSVNPADGSYYMLMGCGMVGGNCKRGDERDPTDIDPDSTPMLQELITAPSGKVYYHALIGNPTSGFSMEYYIQAGWGDYEQNDPLSASGGLLNGGDDATPILPVDRTRFVSPLAPTSVSGSGTGAPRKVIFRQTVRAEDFDQEVHKGSLANKPIITQSLNDGELNSFFQADMSNSDYYTMDTTGQLINTMSVTDSEGKKLADFDQDNVLDMVDVNTGDKWNKFGNANPTGISGITAGRYIKVGGEGVDEYISRRTRRGMSYEDAWRLADINVRGQIDTTGDYEYSDGNFNLKGIDWGSFWDPSQNVPDI